MSDERKKPTSPGELYIAGLQGIQTKCDVDIEEALKIALEDLEATQSDEHIEPTRQAYEILKGEKK